jgi:predicted chitinase
MTPAEWRAALVKIAPRGKPWILDGLADAMPAMVDRFDINTAVRQQHFLAQLAHESDHFQTTREYALTRAGKTSATPTRATASASGGAA